MEQQTFQVDLRGVVDLLSVHLYSTPDVYLRELLQNAVDALTARRQLEPGHVGRIRVRTAGGALAVTDDGVGLTEPQVHEFLATVGRSSKRDELGLGRSDFIGQFGIGLLSGFVVADTLEVVTRSVTGTAPLRWVGNADGTYLLDAGPADAPVGTTVRVVPRRGEEHRTEPAEVLRLVRHWASLLAVPVDVVTDDGTVVVGGKTLPWAAACEQTVAPAAYADGRQPLVRHVPVLPDDATRAELLAVGTELLGDTFLDAVPLRADVAGVTGVAYVLAHPTHPAGRQRHRVHLRRMLAVEGPVDLLPPWAFYVRCVVDGTELRPTASREQLVSDETLLLTTEALGECLRSHLVMTARQHPERLATLVRVHQRALKALVAHETALLAVFAEHLTISTTFGPMSLADLGRQAADGVLEYAADDDTFRQIAPVASAQGRLVANGGFTYDADLVRGLADITPGLVAARLEAVDLMGVMEEVAEADRAAADQLAAAGTATLAEQQVSVQVRQFDPANVPVLYLHDRAVELQRAVERASDRLDDLWGAATADLASAPATSTLCLNLRNDLVRRLLPHAGTTRGDRAVQVLYVQALLLGHHPLRGSELRLLSGALGALIGEDLA